MQAAENRCTKVITKQCFKEQRLSSVNRDYNSNRSWCNSSRLTMTIWTNGCLMKISMDLMTIKQIRQTKSTDPWSSFPSHTNLLEQECLKILLTKGCQHSNTMLRILRKILHLSQRLRNQMQRIKHSSNLKSRWRNRTNKSWYSRRNWRTVRVGTFPWNCLF